MIIQSYLNLRNLRHLQAVFSNLHVQRIFFAENWTNFAENLKKKKFSSADFVEIPFCNSGDSSENQS